MLGSIIAVFIFISVMMASDTQNFVKTIGIDSHNMMNTSRDLNGNAVYAFSSSGEPLPLQSWGTYKKVDLAGESYFAAYLNGFLYGVSSDKLLANGQVSKILQNNRNIQYIGWDGEGRYNLMLSDGYELALKNIDFNGNKLYLELTRQGQVVDSKVVQPIMPGATIADKTYYFRTDVGSAKGIVTIAVHIQTIVGWAGPEATLAIVDGVWQISDTLANSTAQEDNIIYNSDYGAGIWRMNPDGSNKIQLSVHGWFAEYSPDNSKIAFSDFYNNGIWIMDADGANPVQLTSSGEAPSWSPDGGQITYFKGDTAGADRRIWVMNADGTNARKLSDNPGSFPKWSPGGDRIAYHGESNNGIWVIDPDGSNEMQLFSNGGYPAWSPKGDKIAYVSLIDWNIWTMNSDGSGQTRLTNHKGMNPAWSRDGTQIAYEDLASNKGIWVINSDGSGDQNINKEGHSPDWSNVANQATHCCSMTSPINLDFSGKSGVPTVVSGVLFTVIWKDVEFKDDSLWCLGSEEYPLHSGVWHSAAVNMDFKMLPCSVCKIIADVNGHGPEARLEGQLLKGGPVVATSHNKQKLSISALPGNPFVSAKLSGTEAEWASITLE